MRKTFTLLLLSYFFINLLQAQNSHNHSHQHEKCATHLIHDQLYITNPQFRQSVDSYEQSLLNYSPGQHKSNTVYTVPVVVHVIHTGQAVGSGINISDAQIHSAITALNEDFRRLPGTNGFGGGVDTHIEFCLATRDPNGNPTTGINRVNGSSVTNYATQGITAGQGSGASETAVKNLSIWPNTSYYNIWVVNEIENNNGGAGIQGYAYFPGAPATVDGTVMLYNAFGTVGNLKPYTNMGRVLTHELGHGFALYHTFDNTNSCTSETNCNTQGDRCCDTPPHPGNNINCNTPECGGTQQVSNYMDYTSETCQNRFTANQRTRMRNTFTNTIRAQLLNSQGCMQVNNLDIALESIDYPTGTICETTVEPVITIENLGNQTITSVNIVYNLNGGANSTFNWTGSLATLQTTQVTLPTITASTGSNTLNVNLTSPNGGTDQNTSNNSGSSTFTASQGNDVEFTLVLDRYGSETTWNIKQGNNTLHSGGPYTNLTANGTQTPIVLNFCLADGCYDFEINDSYGDGICCDYGTGSYTLTNNATGAVLASGGQFAFTETTNFCLNQNFIDADFSANNTTITAGSTVQFTDLSTGSATINSWTWNFGDGSPTNNTANPSHTYTTPGVYTVSLTVGDGTLTDTETKNNYITVQAPILCDTITNIGANDQITTYGLAPNAWGGLLGHNGYLINEYADEFTVTSPQNLSSVLLPVGKAVAGTPNSTLTVKVYGNNNNLPGAVLGSKSVFIDDLNELAYNFVTFDNAITVNNKFFVGFEINYGQGDTVLVYTAAHRGGTGLNTLYHRFQNTWSSSSQLFQNTLNSSIAHELIFATNPLVNQFAISGNFCEGSPISLDATGTQNYTEQYWIVPGHTPDSLNGLSATLNYTNSGTYDIFLVTEGACDFKISDTTITINDLPASPNPSATAICSGNTATINSNYTGAGTVEWFANASGGTALTSGLNYTTPSLTSSQTYYVQINEGGCVSQRASVLVQVSSQPDTPQTSSTVSVCSGNTATLTATSNVGDIRWFSTPTGGTALAVSNSFTTPVITSNTTYYVESFVGNCASNRIAINVQVGGLSEPSVSDVTLCSGQSTVLDAQATSGNIEWFDAPTGGNLIFTGSSFATPTLSVTTSYYVRANAGGSCVSPRKEVVVTVNPVPTSPSVSGASICEGSSATLTATGNGTINWYLFSTGGVPIHTGNSFTTPTLSADETYFVGVNNNGCNSSRIAVTVHVSPVPNLPTSSNTTICSGNTASLTASTNTGIVEWFTTSSGGTAVGTGNSFTTPTLFTTTTYYIQSRLSNCVSSRRAVTVTVNSIDTPVGNDVDICSGNTATLTANANSGSVEWFANASGGSVLQTGTSFTTPVLTNTTTYYVQTNTGACLSSRIPIQVNVNSAPAQPVANNATICEGNSVLLSATVSGGANIVWYETSSSTSILSSGNDFTTPTLNSSTTYYAASTFNGCENSNRTPVVVTVNPTPSNPTLSFQDFCNGQSTTLNAVITSGTVSWFNAPSGGTALGTSTSFTTSNISNTTTFYAEVLENGCRSSRVSITVSPTATDDASFTYSTNQICIGGNNPTPSISGLSGGTFTSSPIGLVFVSSTTGEVNSALSNSGSYTITYTTNGTCPNSEIYNLDVINAPDASFSYSVNEICNNENNITASLNNTNASFTSTPTGLVFADASTGEITVNQSMAGQYIITNEIPSTGFCPSATATQNLTILESPTASASSDISVVDLANPTAVNFDASGSNSANSYHWSFGDGSAGIGVNATHNYTTIGNYIVTLTASNDKCSDTDNLEIQVINTVSNQLNSFEKEISLFPNPTSNYFSLTANGLNNEKLTIQIFDNIGKMVKTIEWNLTHEEVLNVDVNSFSSGLYHVSIIGEEVFFNYQLVIRK